MSAPKVYAAIQAVMKAVGVIGKDRTNPQQGYQFRGIDDVMAELQGHMVTHGLVVAPRVTHAEREMVPTKSGGSMASVRLTVDFTLISVEDGSSISVTTIGEAMDSGDKASNKAMSAAFKYFATLTFVIPTKEPKDTENDSPEMAARPAPQRASSATTARTPAPRPAQKPSSAVFPNYGRMKGQPIAGAPVAELNFYAAGARKSLADPAKQRFHAQEQALLNAIEAELAQGQRQDGDMSPSDNSVPF